MSSLEIIGIVNRLNAVPKSMKPQVMAELESAIAAQQKHEAAPLDAVSALRDMLTWDEVKSNPVAVARIARSLRALRG